MEKVQISVLSHSQQPIVWHDPIHRPVPYCINTLLDSGSHEMIKISINYWILYQSHSPQTLSK